MKLLIDMNLSPLWVGFLSDSGFESVHWSSVGAPSAPDTQIMEYAAANGFVVFTHDLDYGALLAIQKAAGPSVIQLRTQDVMPEAVGRIVVEALRACGTQLETGALVTVDVHRSRIRLLPIYPIS